MLSDLFKRFAPKWAGVLMRPLSPRISFQQNARRHKRSGHLVQRLALGFMACLFIFSSLVIISPWQPKTYAAYESVTFFSTQPGNLTEQSQKEVAKAFDKGDSYKEAGWKDIVVYVKDLMGTGPQTLTFNEDLSKRVACMNNGIAPDECKGRQPSFTTTLFCTPSNQSQPFSTSKPQDVEAYYEIVYAVGLKNNGSKGSEFVNRDDFNGIAGYADVVRYSKSNPELAYYDIEDKTREFSERIGGVNRHDVDHYNNNDRKSNKKGTFGILDGESICQPSPSFKKDMKMVNYNKIADENEKLAFSPSGAAAGADDDGASAGELSCGMTGALGWIFCPLVDMINSAISTIDSMITTLLTISPDNFNISCKKAGGETLDSAACSRAKSYYSAWSSFRTLALGIVIIAALVVIVGSALGYELLDAYTIRKVLPRIIFAIIFIALSWHILSFFVILTNDIGNGVRWLIYQPFAEIGAIEIDGSNMGFLTIFGALGIAGGVVSMFIYGPAILTFLLVGLIIMSAAVLIMVLRELIVILLVILAPIGIACYILPNTQKGWQLWQNTITTMLLAFPIIAAIIAFGRVFAATSFAGGEAGPLQQFIGLIAYFIPYFLIPYSFKLAGGAIAGLANIANNAERGVFDRMRNARANAAKRRTEEMASGQRKGVVASGVRRFRNMHQGGVSMSRSGRSKYKAFTQNQSVQIAAKAMENDAIGGLMDDDATEVAQGAQNRSDFISQYIKRGKTADQAHAALGKLEAATGAQMGSKAMRLAAYRADMLSSSANDPGIKLDEIGTAIADAKIAARDAAMIRKSQVIRSDGLMDLDSQAALMKSNKARPDRASMSFSDARDFLNFGGEVTPEVSKEFNKQGLAKVSGYTATHGDERSSRVIAHRLMQEINESGGEPKIETLAKFADIQDTLSNASPDMKEIYTSVLQRNVGGRTIVQHIDDNRTQLKAFRREYGGGGSVSEGDAAEAARRAAQAAAEAEGRGGGPA